MILKNRVAIVTGGSRGIGFEIALSLGIAGAKVAICGRDRGDLENAQLRLDENGVTQTGLCLNVAAPDAAAALLGHVEQLWGGLDILVNNAGGLETTGRFMDLNAEDWHSAFELNLFSVVRLCREAMPLLKRSPHARVINISSVTAKQPGDFNPHYSAAKLALTGLTKHLATSLAREGILVNSVSPGIIRTSAWDEFIGGKARQENRDLSQVRDEENARAANSMPIGRLGEPQEVAALVRFLASDAASFITGADIPVDGGKARSL